VGEYLWIDLGPVHGQYTIQADETMQIVMLLSPISGQRVYRYNNQHNSSSSDQQQGETTAAHDPNRWMCTDDGHVLEGLLVRDLIRQIQGVPNL
jgi:Frataxin-like domain